MITSDGTDVLGGVERIVCVTIGAFDSSERALESSSCSPVSLSSTSLHEPLVLPNLVFFLPLPRIKPSSSAKGSSDASINDPEDIRFDLPAAGVVKTTEELAWKPSACCNLASWLAAPKVGGGVSEPS